MFLFTATIIYQQKKIIKLKNEINIKNEPKEKQAVSKKNGRNNPINSPFTVQAVQKNLEDHTKEIKGTIISKTGNLLLIDGEIVDFPKLSRLTENELHQSSSSFPKTIKKYKVLVSDKTKLGSFTLQDFLAGKKVVIETDELVYKSDHFYAMRAMFIIPKNEEVSLGTSPEALLKQLKILA